MFLGVGPVTAMKLIREHRSLEKVVENLDSKVWLRFSIDGGKVSHLIVNNKRQGNGSLIRLLGEVIETKIFTNLP